MESIRDKVERLRAGIDGDAEVTATIRNAFVNGSDQVRLFLELKQENGSMTSIEIGVADFYATEPLERETRSRVEQLFGRDVPLTFVSEAREHAKQE